MRQPPEALILFAAGFGKRMGALTASQPKPLIRVAGRALIDHALALADQLPLKRKVVNLHYLPDQITRHLSDRRDILFSLEQPDILETGGGLRRALPLLGPGPVFSLNTDGIWAGPNPLQTLSAAWDPDRMDALLLLVPKDRATGHLGPGDFALAEDGRISRSHGEALTHVFVGVQIIRTDGLAAIPAKVFSLNLLWDRMIRDGRAYGTVHPGGWCDVGSPEGVAAAEQMLSRADV